MTNDVAKQINKYMEQLKDFCKENNITYLDLTLMQELNTTKLVGVTDFKVNNEFSTIKYKE